MDRPWKRKSLGLSFTVNRMAKRRLAPQSIERSKQKVRELTRRTRGGPLEEVIGSLTRCFAWLAGLLSLPPTPSVLRDLESWAHRRPRSLLWKRWKRGTVRFAELRKRGVSPDLAAQSAGSSPSVWRLGRSPALQYALPGKSWQSLGLPS